MKKPRIVETEKGDRMTMKIGKMRASELVTGAILTVLGALMIAESVITMLGNPFIPVC